MPHQEAAGDRTVWDPTSELILPTFYEQFMRTQEIPIVRGIGVRDVRDLPRRPWKRLGGDATFIQLGGMNTWSMYVIEVPAAGALKPERHIYEEEFYVVEGRGSTEVWKDGGSRQVFEWQPGTLFSVPLNAWHRLVNATSSPALVMGFTTANAVINRFDNERFVFDNPFDFAERYGGEDDYFKVNEALETRDDGRAMRRSTVIPDLVNCYLPLDNTRAPGYRWFAPQMANNKDFLGFVAEYPVGRYSKAHAHPSGPVLICVRGKGYTYTWPAALGTRPWQDGAGDQVLCQEYVAGGMVSAAPGGSEWFHQHFGVAKDSFRMMAVTAGKVPEGVPGTRHVHHTADLQAGGRSIRYADEDPHVRHTYEEKLRSEGARFGMPDDAYR
jgi:quercetin dioxygenase-like cupin family protein